MSNIRDKQGNIPRDKLSNETKELVSDFFIKKFRRTFYYILSNFNLDLERYLFAVGYW